MSNSVGILGECNPCLSQYSDSFGFLRRKTRIMYDIRIGFSFLPAIVKEGARVLQVNKDLGLHQLRSKSLDIQGTLP